MLPLVVIEPTQTEVTTFVYMPDLLTTRPLRTSVQNTSSMIMTIELMGNSLGPKVSPMVCCGNLPFRFGG